MGLPCGWQVNGKGNVPQIEPVHPMLVVDRVRHVGDSIVMVIAETKDQAKAAAQAIVIDFDQQPVAVSVSDAVKPGAPQVWDQAPGNICFDWEIGDRAKTDEGFAKADKIVEIEVVNNRLVPNAMEPRAAIGEYDAGTGDYTLWTTSQNPHLIRLLMAAFTLHVPEHKLRIIAPDIGGGFGSKIFHYAEEVLVTWAAQKIGRPCEVDGRPLRVVRHRCAWS